MLNFVYRFRSDPTVVSAYFSPSSFFPNLTGLRDLRARRLRFARIGSGRISLFCPLRKFHQHSFRRNVNGRRPAMGPQNQKSQKDVSGWFEIDRFTVFRLPRFISVGCLLQFWALGGGGMLPKRREEKRKILRFLTNRALN